MIDVDLVVARIVGASVVVVTVGVAANTVYWLIRAIQMLREQMGEAKAQKTFDRAYQNYQGSYEDFELDWESGKLG